MGPDHMSKEEPRQPDIVDELQKKVAWLVGENLSLRDQLSSIRERVGGVMDFIDKELQK